MTRSFTITRRVAIAAVGASLSLGCASGPRATLPRLQHRASYDLGCPAGYLQLDHVDERTKVVAGCGRHLVYIEDCMAAGSELLCSWRLDSPTTAQASWPAAPAAQTATPSGRVYRTHLYDDDYQHLENRTAPGRPAEGRRMPTHLYGGEATEVPPGALDRRY